ncbi:thioesterase II family protein [Azospirillum sp. B510]|uniref:thioesterase II family protein n=1 Tax=Azospirillum sp. (strain B510) TaxID=137722 RepID=UPI001FFF99DC|nr:alpha/beta fold hydrolase [Azospirillum sp. B510]
MTPDPRDDRTVRPLWLEPEGGRPSAAMRLFCFAHAGGSAALYRSWCDRLPPDLEVCPVQLPGHGARVLEPPFRRMDALLDALSVALAGLLDRPFAIFGHSMGAIVAYAAAHALRGPGGRGPEHLFVSARTPPSRGTALASLHTRSDAGLVEVLHAFGGTPPAVLRNPEFLHSVLPVFRADLELLETYRLPAAPRLNCPITAFGGTDDPACDPDDLDTWAALTKTGYRRVLFPGGHFYLEPCESDLLAVIARDLRT